MRHTLRYATVITLMLITFVTTAISNPAFAGGASAPL
jgi:hypothetical protein